jgi:hypothetical protein
VWFLVNTCKLTLERVSSVAECRAGHSTLVQLATMLTGTAMLGFSTAAVLQAVKLAPICMLTSFTAPAHHSSYQSLLYALNAVKKMQ